MRINKVYLGDGVYAQWDGWHIVLTTENGITVTNTISLEASVLRALIDYAKAYQSLEDAAAAEL